MAAERVVPNAFRARSLNGSVTPMVGAGRDRPVTVVPVTVVPVRVVPVRVDPGMLGRVPVEPAMVEPALVAPGKVVEKEPPGMGPQEMAAVSRFAVRQVDPGMRFAQAVGANAPMGIAPPAVMLPGIGSTEPAAAQSGPSSAIVPSSAIGPDLSAGLRTLARRNADPLSAVPLSAVPLTVDPSIAVRAAVPLAVPPAVLPGALAPRVLGLAGRMGPGPTVAILWPPALTAAEIAQAPGP